MYTLTCLYPIGFVVFLKDDGAILPLEYFDIYEAFSC